MHLTNQARPSVSWILLHAIAVSLECRCAFAQAGRDDNATGASAGMPVGYCPMSSELFASDLDLPWCAPTTVATTPAPTTVAATKPAPTTTPFAFTRPPNLPDETTATQPDLNQIMACEEGCLYRNWSTLCTWIVCAACPECSNLTTQQVTGATTTALVVLCDPACESFMLGDGSCQAICNTAECGFDHGDCAGGETEEEICDCANATLGNGVCNDECNNALCEFDGGDCAEVDVTPEPEVCWCRGSIWLGDGICDAECNNAPCGYDAGDCIPPDPPLTAPMSSSTTTPSPTTFAVNDTDLRNTSSSTSTLSTSGSSSRTSTSTQSSTSTSSPPLLNCTGPSSFYPVNWSCPDELEFGESCIAETLDHPCVDSAEIEFMCLGNMTAQPDGKVEAVNASGSYAINCKVCACRQAVITEIVSVQATVDITYFLVSGYVVFGPNAMNGSVAEEGIDGYQVFVVDQCLQKIVEAGPVVASMQTASSLDCCDSDRYTAYFSSVQVDNFENMLLMVVPVLPGGIALSVGRIVVPEINATLYDGADDGDVEDDGGEGRVPSATCQIPAVGLPVFLFALMATTLR